MLSLPDVICLVLLLQHNGLSSYLTLKKIVISSFGKWKSCSDQLLLADIDRLLIVQAHTDLRSGSRPLSLRVCASLRLLFSVGRCSFVDCDKHRSASQWASNWAHGSLSFSTIKQNTDTDTKSNTHTHTCAHSLSLNGTGDRAIKHCTIRIHIRNEHFLLGMGYLCVCVCGGVCMCVCVCVTLASVDCLSAPPPSLWHPNEGIISTSHGTWNCCNLAFINVFAGSETSLPAQMTAECFSMLFFFFFFRLFFFWDWFKMALWHSRLLCLI